MLGKLNTGATIPLLGFGTYPGQGVMDIKAAIRAAIEAGYRHFDTATCYGSEAPLGEVLREAFEAGIFTREEVFVTSKLWCSDNNPDGVLPALKKSLSSVGLDYLDLYLIHWPIRSKRNASLFSLKEDDFLPLDIKGVWQAMETCVDLGLSKAIGVSNFSSKKIGDILTYARIAPAVNQVEMHPMWQQKRLRAYCSKVNVHVSAWSPLGSSGSWWGSPLVLQHPILMEIATKHAKTPAQVALRWGVEQEVSVLPKSFNKGRIVENSQIFGWQLTQEDHEKISTMQQKKIIEAHFLCNATTSPYKTVEELWDGEI